MNQKIMLSNSNPFVMFAIYGLTYFPWSVFCGPFLGLSRSYNSVGMVDLWQIYA